MSGFLSVPFLKLAYHILSKTSKKNDTKKQYLEPLSTLFKLALVSFKEDGTKVAISNHRIYIQTPSILQGTIRSVYGNTREEIHYLLQPILQCVKLYPPQNHTELTYLYKLAIKGLRQLKKSYDNDSSTVCYTIDLYISILDRTLLSKSIYIDSYASSAIPSSSAVQSSSAVLPSSNSFSGSLVGSPNATTPLNASDSPRPSTSTSSSVPASLHYNHLFDEIVDRDLTERVGSGERTMLDIPENAPLESVWRQVWSKDEIHLIYNLFLLTDQTPANTSGMNNPNASGDMKHNRVGYISSIEDILRAKEEIIDEGIHRANLWI